MKIVGPDWSALSLLCARGVAHAAQPLVTDDVNTQGAGNHQIELNASRIRTPEDKTREGGAVYTFVAADSLDIAFGIPRRFSSSAGFGDTALVAKWRFVEGKSGGMALRPELFLPTGLGTGALGASLLWIGTLNLSDWSFHANLGLTHFRYRLDADREANRRAIWRASAASIRRIGDRWQLVSDVGLERNVERGNDTHPAFVLAGVIYSPAVNLDFDAGIRTALNCKNCSGQIRRQVTAGVTWRF